ncbi:SURF1 family protein [Massilia sp. PAMC28688]|uniref:SURF1 family protein n=1 Tax=Massilia sp. PAMC28688 TaxID=2861283 RepID=UPI001C629FEF|nr:SURF1 family protein [Massilia sp. PAMC28688]QYF94416.1 SURF1 family protein [Massilia sp. PAMC28688]
MPNIEKSRFRFRVIPFIATALLVALGVSLGQWQDRRAAEKLSRQALLTERSSGAPFVLGPQLREPAEMEYRKVSVAGQFVADYPLFLNNRPQNGKVGFYLVMPFKIAGSDTHVLVARGWLPRYTGEYDRLPEFGTPSGTVIVEGIARASMGKVMQLGEANVLRPRAILQNLEPAQFAAATGKPVQPFFIEQSGPADPADKLVRDWPAPALGADKHKGYAFQWYALAVMALLFFITTGFRRGTNANRT